MRSEYEVVRFFELLVLLLVMVCMSSIDMGLFNLDFVKSRFNFV